MHYHKKCNKEKKNKNKEKPCVFCKMKEKWEMHKRNIILYNEHLEDLSEKCQGSVLQYFLSLYLLLPKNKMLMM